MEHPNVVIMNDTDVDGQHFGCQRVMATINEKIAARGGNVIGSVKVGMPWHDIPLARTVLNGADLVIINGEGTLHHNKKRGKWLLEAANFARKGGAKVALINALWQENGADWARLAAPIDIISCRDSRSATALSDAIGRPVPWIGDLSMCSGPIYDDGPRDGGIVVGCSVHAKVTTKLAALQGGLGATAQIVPVTPKLKFVAPQLRGLRRLLKSTRATLKHRQFMRRYPDASFLPDEAAYIERIKQADLSVTGRFHAVCLAAATLTPFVAVASNSWKIEALLDDIGLAKDRLVALPDLSREKILNTDWTYTAQETANIRARMTEWEAAADALFDDIFALV